MSNPLAVTPEGVALGVVDAWMWARKPKGEADVKESERWVEGYGVAADLAEQMHDGELGPKALWTGMQRMREFAVALEASRAVFAGDG